MTMHNYKLDKLSKRVQDLFKDPPTFQEFATKWKEMDGLSRSLFELALSDPQLAGQPRHFELLKGYLRRLGVQAPEPIDENYIKTLQGDD